MISDAMNAKLNEQITHEFHASHVYLSMACALDAHGLLVAPKWFRRQADEEREHALKILDYITEVDGTVKLAAIPEPPAKFDTVLAAAEAAYAHEQKVTKQIHDLVALAEQEQDYATRSFLNWFVDEQVEELRSTGDLVQLARLAGPSVLQLEAAIGHLLARQS